jgi:uncharacterized membrane protein
MSTDPAPPTPSVGGTADPDPSPLAGTAAGARRSVAGYATHAEAVRAVDWLSDEGFPVQQVAIVGSGLKAVEQVTGRVTVGRAAAQGAMQGAVIGVFFALLFGLFFTGPAFFGLLVYAVVLSALFGAALGAVSHAALGGTQDFGSISTIQADRYDVMVDHDVADEAARVLERQPAGR